MPGLSSDSNPDPLSIVKSRFGQMLLKSSVVKKVI